METNSFQNSVRDNQKALKYYELYKINLNKIKDLEKLVTNHLETISRLLQQNKAIRQQKSNIILAKDGVIKDLQTKLVQRASTIKKLQDNVNKKTIQFTNLKKQQEAAAILFVNEITQLKTKINDNQNIIDQCQNLIDTVYQRVSSLIKSNINFKLDQSLVINNLITELQTNKSVNLSVDNSQSVLSNSNSIFEIKPLQNLIGHLQVKYKEMNQTILRLQKEIKNYDKKFADLNEKYNLALARQRNLKDQIRICKEDVNRMKQNYNSMDEILHKSQEEKTQIARKYEKQMMRIRKAAPNKSSLEELRQQRFVLMYKIEQLELKIRNLIQQNLQIKEIHIKESENMLIEIKKLQKQYEQEVEKHQIKIK